MPASRAAESANPGLWDDLVFANALTLGPTGGVAKDVSGYGRDGVLSAAMNPGDDWVIGEKGWALDFDGNADNTEGPSLGHAEPFTASVWCETDIAGSAYPGNAYVFHQYDSGHGDRGWG